MARLLFAVASVAATGSLVARDYAPIIEDGKIWVYGGTYLVNESMQSEYGYVKHWMKFDDRVEINGKEYCAFKLYKSVYKPYTGETAGIEREIDRDEVNYMREEDGRFYKLTYFLRFGNRWLRTD